MFPGLVNGFRLAAPGTGIAAATSGIAHAEVSLAKFFSSNMVIQRGLPVHVWGECNSNSSVQVSLGTQHVAGVARADATWQVTLDPVPVGGPYTLSVASDGSVATVTNVLCGDVWLCSGQSNMQCPVKDVDPVEQKVALVNRPNVRLCTVAKTPSPKPLSSADIRWSVCTPESAWNFSAVACFFVSELLKAPTLANVPIGVVDSSVGGTTCEGWIPEPALASFDPKDLHNSMFGIKPANLYNAMIAPLGQSAFRGVVWYQGESNSAHPETYPKLLAIMISEWSKQFTQPALPFSIIQLPDYANLWEGFYWPWIREMQAKAVDQIPNTALVVGINTTDGFNLHPKEKLEIGRRAALQARRIIYGEDIVASGPILKSVKVEGPTVRVVFDTGGEALASKVAGGVKGFALAGADGEYRFADAVIDGDSVIVQSGEVPQPKTVRYAWAAMPQASLINRVGLPVAPFRTDRLAPSNVEIQVQQVTRRVATSAYEIVIDANGMATSLVAQGVQFLSNEAGAAGGGKIPGFWGPKALINIREIGPRLLTCSDDDVTLQMAFDEKSMQWTFMNRGKDPITYQLALSQHVHAPDSLTDGKASITRGSASLTLDGFDSITNTPTGAMLISQIKAASAKTISLK
jgi:sialate O-acetylesterase